MDNKELHYRYAISYLLSIIVLIVALAYYDTPDLVDKFSFALTLSSLLLAFLAIFYTIVSAHKQDAQFSRILEATSKLGSSVSDINDAAKSISRLTNDIPEHFQSINSKIDGIQFDYQALTKVEKKSELATNPEDDEDDTNIKDMIFDLHFRGMAVLYFFSRSYGNGKAIDYSDFDKFEMADSKYAVAFLSGFSATKLIEFTLHKDSIIPVRCDLKLMSKLKSIIETISEVVDDDVSKRLLEMIKWVDDKYE